MGSLIAGVQGSFTTRSKNIGFLNDIKMSTDLALELRYKLVFV